MNKYLFNLDFFFIYKDMFVKRIWKKNNRNEINIKVELLRKLLLQRVSDNEF